MTQSQENKKDIRYQRTDRMIKEAYTELLLKKSPETITVKELSEKAGISRRAFYSHYESIDDLLAAIQDELSVQFFEEVKDFDHIENVEKLIAAYFNFADCHGIIFEKINYDLNLNYLRGLIVKQVADLSANNFKALRGRDKYTRAMVYRFMNAACVGMYRQWIRDGRVIPKEQAIHLTAELIGNGVKSLC